MSVPITRTPEPGLVATTAVERAAGVVRIVRLAVFGLAPLVYLAQGFHTVAGGLFAAAIFAWALWRLATLSPSKRLIAADVAFVVVAALLAPVLVSASINDPSLSFTRVLAYPTIVSLAISQPRRWSFLAMAVITTATVIGDTFLFGSPNATALFLVVDWAGAAWVRVLVVRAAQATDQAAADFQQARLHDDVAAARVRFEREQLATLHDTAASTLMMVGDAAAVDQTHVAAQARRDLEILTESPVIGEDDRPVNLYDYVRSASGESRIPVDLPDSVNVIVPLHLARAVGAATREALNNVRRHSGATTVTISLTPHSVTITDDGVGFDTTQDAPGFGLRGSIKGRMRSVGGRADVMSERGAGTSVHLSWTPFGADRDLESDTTVRHHLLRNYQIGLAIGQAGVAVQLCGTGRLFASGEAWLASLSAVVLLLAVSPLVVAFAFGIVRNARWVAVGAVVMMCEAYVATLPIDVLITPVNWVAVSGGWALAALLSGWVTSRMRVCLACLVIVASWLVQGVIVVGRLPTGAALTFVGYGLASMAVMQCSAICLAWVLAESVRDAEDLSEQRHALAAYAAVRAAIQQDYRSHFANLNDGIVALLHGLADGTLSPDEPAVRNRARVEYARIRRLFAQRGSFDHPLLQRLRPSLDAAGDRGVTVEFEIAAEPVAVVDSAIEPAAAAVVSVVDNAKSIVRVVVSTAEEQTTVSALGDSPESVDAVEQSLAGSDYDVRRQGEMVWLRVHLRAGVRSG